LTILREDPNAPLSDEHINCIVVTSITVPKIEFPEVYKPKKKALFTSEVEGGMYHSFINYSMNKKAITFGELFKIDTCFYVEQNYKSNSCYVTILVDTFYKAFQKESHYKFDATYEDFCELLDLDIKKDSIGLTISKSMLFFKKYNIGLCVVGVYGVIEMFKPDIRNKKISPDCLYILVSNGHCYKLNDQMKRFSQMIWKSDTIISDEMTKISIVNTRNIYFIHKCDDFNYNVMYVHSLKDIMNDIKNTLDEQNTVK
jgi:hypothetical protein